MLTLDYNIFNIYRNIQWAINKANFIFDKS